MKRKNVVLNLANGIIVTGSSAVDVTMAVPTPRDETVIALAVVGPVWGHCLMMGIEQAPDSGGALLVNAQNAAWIIAAITDAFDAAGAGAALTAHMDQARAEMAAEKAEGE